MNMPAFSCLGRTLQPFLVAKFATLLSCLTFVSALSVHAQDGTIDPNFAPGAGAFSTKSLLPTSVRNIHLQPDGKILIVGAFNSVDGLPRYGLARLNADGTVDPSFIPDLSESVEAGMLTRVQADGKIYFAPSFFQSTDPLLERFNPDGTRDTTFSLDPFATDSSIDSLTILPDGMLLVTANGADYYSPERKFFRLYPDGLLDPSFHNPTDGSVGSPFVYPDGRILVLGSFTTVNGIPTPRFSRLNSDGSVDPSFKSPFVVLDIYGRDSGPKGFAVAPDGKIMTVGGDLTQTNGYGPSLLRRLNTDGSVDASFVVDPAVEYGSPVFMPDGKMIVPVNDPGVPYSGDSVARLNPDGTLDTTFESVSLNVTIDQSMESIVRDQTGNLLVCGLLYGPPPASQKALVRLKQVGETFPAPQIISAASASGQAGSPFNYQIAATNTAVSYGILNLPPGLTINGQTGLISGIPSVPGSFVLTVSATNLGGTGSAPLILNFSPAAISTPVITSKLRLYERVYETLYFNYGIQATNSPTFYSATGLPVGLRVNPQTGLITGFLPVGTYTFNILAGNAGGFGTANLELIVSTDPPPVPIITSPLTATAQVGQPFSYQITATGYYSGLFAGGLPAGLTVPNSLDTEYTGLISGIPTVAGVYKVTLIALTPGTYDGLATLVLTVAPATPASSSPTITSAAVASGQVGTVFTYQIRATDSPTSYAAVDLPAGFNVDTASGLISGVPQEAGTFTLHLTASNAIGDGTAILTLTITADPTIAAPAITSALSVARPVGQPVTYQITASNGPLSYAATGLPAGLRVDNATGLITGTPTAVGMSAIGISATNTGGTGTATLILTIAPAVPTVTLTATTPTVTAGSGNLGVFTLSLSAAQDHDVFVAFTIKGTAANGNDYVLLKATKKIKAGKTSKPIKITPLGEGAGTGVKRTVVLVLQPGDGYEVGTAGKVKVKIIGQ